MQQNNPRYAPQVRPPGPPGPPSKIPPSGHMPPSPYQMSPSVEQGQVQQARPPMPPPPGPAQFQPSMPPPLGQAQRLMPPQAQRPMPPSQRPMPPPPGQAQRPMPPPPGQAQRPMPPSPAQGQVQQAHRPMPPPPGQMQQAQRPMPPPPGQAQRPMPPPPGQGQRQMPPPPGQGQRPMPPPPGQAQRPMPPGQSQFQRPMPPPPGQVQRPMPPPPGQPVPPSNQYPQQNGAPNGHLRPHPPRPLYPPRPGQPIPPQAQGPPQTMPGPPTTYPAQQPGGYAPPRSGGMRPAPQQAAARPLPPGYAAPPAPAPAGAPEQPQGQTKLSNSMMPRPCALERPAGSPREFYHRGMSVGAAGNSLPILPGSHTDTIYVDDGSARLRFMRLTANAVGSDPGLMGKSGVPFAVVMTPFANTAPGEAPVPVVDFSNVQIGGPLRCERCNAYANPGFKFVSGGSQFQCNLCHHTNTTPTEHFSPISPATGQRMDADSRHELRVGSVDYLIGSKDYCIRPPRPACYLFAIDVSATAIASGLSAAAMMSIKSAIGAGLLPGSREGARVAIMTFDRALHFFDARGSEEGKAVSMQYVPDVMDPFVPLGGDALFLTPSQAVLAIDSAIETHGLGPEHRQAANPAAMAPSGDSALGSALEAIKAAFADCGGKGFVIAGALPSIGVSKLERRGGGAIGGGEERDMGLLKEAFPNYEILGCELADVQASVDLFLAPSSVYIDASTLSRVPRACGGRMYLFTSFDAVRDGASLHRSLCAAASGARAFEALLRVRTSPGLEARGEYVGHFGRPQRGDDVGGPVFDASSTLALEISVTSKLLDDDRNNGQNRPYAGTASLYDDACVQCAILFTDSAGRRRIRVHTSFATKTSVLQDVFRHADVDAVASFLCKKAASAVLVGGTSFSKACEALTEKTSQTLYVYRKYCTTASLSGQLILPEALKVLPLMILGLTKSAAFRKSALSVQSGDAVTVDERAAALSFLISGTPSEVAAMCYPRMWEIQEIGDEIGKPLPAPSNPIVNAANGQDEKETANREPIAMPNTLLLSAESLTDKRILLIENGMQMVVWLGSQVEKSAAEDVIASVAGGRLCIRAETAGSAALTKGISERGKRVAKMIERIVSERRGLSRPQVVLRSAPGAGGEAKYVIPLLVEDRGSGFASYVEYLRHVHKRVMDKMANDSAQNDMQTWEMLSHGY